MKRRGFIGALFSAPVVAKVVPKEVTKQVVAYVPPPTIPGSAFLQLSAGAYTRQSRVPYAYSCCNGRYIDGAERRIDHSLDCYRRNDAK
jgi:hypothetical protein